MRRNSIIANVDLMVVLLYLFLVMAGWLNIYSAVYNEEHSSILDMSQSYGKQLIWIGSSLIIALLIMVIDSKFFVTFSYVIYAFLILLLVVVLLVGVEKNGAKSWFVIGSFQLQPAEFAKYGAALAISKMLSTYNFSFKNHRNQLVMAGLLFVPVVLIILQNDTGSALVYFVFLIPFFREGMSGLILFFGVYFAFVFILSLVLSPLIFIITFIILAFVVALVFHKNWAELLKGALVLLAASIPFVIYQLVIDSSSFSFQFVLIRASFVAGLILLLSSVIKRIPYIPLITSVFLTTVLFSITVDFAFNNVLESHHRDRINNLLGIESDPLGFGYNVNQSKIAIGSGGFFGKGFLEGTQTKYDFVPEQSTDFIFCTVGEEWGFLGSSLVVVAFMILMIRLIIMAERQRSVYSRVYGYSVAAILFFHFAINIGMTIGLAPVIGIPLPFFSYGGSSLWFFTILLFTFLRLDTSRLEQLH
ncbi:MAG: rod shape-determining protein RodA [Prolixibacteraceae bacterium]